MLGLQRGRKQGRVKGSTLLAPRWLHAEVTTASKPFVPVSAYPSITVPSVQTHSEE